MRGDPVEEIRKARALLELAESEHAGGRLADALGALDRALEAVGAAARLVRRDLRVIGAAARSRDG